MRWMLAGLFLVLVAVVASVTWFWMGQNADQVIQLQLDLTSRVGAWRMARPVPATSLLLWSFGAGFGVASLMFSVWGLALRRRVARLETELSFSDLGVRR